MALFVLNTGARDAAVCCLRWEWEVRSPELRYSIFVVPKDTVINVKGKRRGAVKGRKRDRVLVLNRVAQSIVEVAMRLWHQDRRAGGAGDGIECRFIETQDKMRAGPGAA